MPLLLENGEYLLLENGEPLLLEDEEELADVELFDGWTLEPRENAWRLDERDASFTLVDRVNFWRLS
jgi:hypothetical protein